MAPYNPGGAGTSDMEDFEELEMNEFAEHSEQFSPPRHQPGKSSFLGEAGKMANYSTQKAQINSLSGGLTRKNPTFVGPPKQGMSSQHFSAKNSIVATGLLKARINRLGDPTPKKTIKQIQTQKNSKERKNGLTNSTTPKSTQMTDPTPILHKKQIPDQPPPTH